MRATLHDTDGEIIADTIVSTTARVNLETDPITFQVAITTTYAIRSGMITELRLWRNGRVWLVLQVPPAGVVKAQSVSSTVPFVLTDVSFTSNVA